MSPRTSPRIAERFGFAVLLAAMPFVLAAGASAGTFYSQGSLDPAQPSSWNSVREGGGSDPADFTSGDVFVIQDAHSMTVSATWAISGAGSGLQIESGGTLELDAGSGALELGGDWTVDGGATFTPNGRTVSFNGASDQQVTSGGDAFDHLTISKSGGSVVLHGDLTVNGVLEMVSGDVQAGSDVLVIGSAGSVSRTSGHVIGQLRKPVAAGNSSQTFEIGDASNYTPLQVTGQEAGFGSAFTLTASTSAGDHGSLASSGIAADRSVNRTYTLVEAGYSDGPFELACNFAGADVDGGATPSRFVVRRRSGGAWTATTTGARTSSGTSATGLAGFGEFSIGEQEIDHYDVSAPSPEVASDVFTTSVTARDVLNERVADDNTTSVTMSSDGAAEFDADGNATFGDNAKALVAGAFEIATRDGTAETLTLTATDANSKTGSRSGLVIQPALSITTTTLPSGSAGTAYSQALAAAGGTAPYSNWTVTIGTLPAGLTLDDGTGVISGSPTTAETQAFTVQVSDAASHTATRALSIGVTAGLAAQLAFVQQPTSALVGAVLSPAVVVRVQDALGNNVPSEAVSLALVGSGSLGGYAPTTTDANGLATFSSLTVGQTGSGKVLEATAAALPAVPSSPFDISCPVLALLPGSLPNGTQESDYAQTITATGGTSPYGFSISAGSLPAGLLLAPSGALGGTPTVSGSFNFTVTATDAHGCTGSQAYSLGIDSNCPAIAVLPASLPAASLTMPFAQAFTAGAGAAPFTVSVAAGALPPGLSLSPAGNLAGTPLASGPATFTVGVIDANLCTGTREYTLEVQALPDPIANLSTQTLLSGNDADGTAKISVTYTLPPGAVAAQVYRAPFGGYPRYDNAGGAAPAIPSYPPGAPWVLTPVSTGGQTDAPATRDFWYYVAFVTNAGGGRSTVSNRSAGSLDYHLGDVSNGFTVGQGNNLVGNEDVSLLGSNYGISEPELTTRGVHYLDVGPTTDLLLTSRPFTDGRIDFEDFIVFATNYGVVSAPQLAAGPAGDGGSVADELRLEAPRAGEPGRTITASLRFSGSGQVQGFSAALAWNAAVVEPLSVTPSGWVEGQGGLVLSPRPGTVDAALLGVRAQGMTGEGEIASVTFRVLRAGDPGIRLSEAHARDARNRPVELGTASVATGGPRTWSTMLAAPWPNPARRDATFEFSLARAGRVDLAVYSVDGRRVKTLVNDEREAGAWREAWDGTDESGHAAAPGLYYTRLQADGRRFTRRLVLLR